MLNSNRSENAKHYHWSKHLKLWVVQMTTATGKVVCKYANSELKAQALVAELRQIHRQSI